MKKVRFAIFLCLLLVALLVWLTGIGGRYITRIGDVFETLNLQLHPGNGFPVSLVLSAQATAQPMSHAVVMMDERDVYLYSDTGSALRNFQHGYARPGLAVGNNRFCVYNQGGKELRLEGRNRSYGTLTTANAIQFVTMSRKGNFAVMTQHDSYQACMTVYSDAMDELYTWYCAEDYPVQAVFSPSGKEIAVAGISSGHGTLQSVLYLVDADGEKNTLRREGSLILDLEYRSADKLLVAYDDAVILYNAHTLEPLATYEMQDALLCADLSGEKGVLLVQGEESRESAVTLTVLSENLEVTRSIQVGASVTQCLLRDSEAWLVGKDQLFCYTINEQATQDTAVVTEYRPVCLVNSEDLLLLTARQLEKVALPQTENKDL